MNNADDKKDFLAKDKLEESERSRKELQTLQDKYASLSSTLDNKVNSLNSEIERLNKDKEKLFQDLVDLKAKHTSCNVTNRKYLFKVTVQLQQLELDLIIHFLPNSQIGH